VQLMCREMLMKIICRAENCSWYRPRWFAPLPIRALSAIAVVVASLSGMPAYAAPEAAENSAATAPASETVISAKKDDKKAIEVVVTAARGAEQNPLLVPQAITAVSAENVESQEYADVDDILRRIPGVGLAPGEGNPNYWQEGFTIRGLGAQRVLTLSDGIRQAGQGIGYGGGNLSLYDTIGIEKIEVLRGPASVLYGTDSFGGVVNVISREPTRRDSFGVGGALRYGYDGQYDRNRAGGYLDFGDQGYAAVIGGSYTRSLEPRLPDDEDANSGSFRQVGLFGKADFYLTEDTKLRFIANNTRNSDVLVTRDEITLPIAVFGPPGSAAFVSNPLYFSFPKYQRTMTGAELTVDDVGESWKEFKTGLYWQQIDREFYRETAFYPGFSPGFAGPPTFVNPNATVAASRTKTDDQVDAFESQTQSRFVFGDHTVTIGLDLGYDLSDLPEVEETQTIAQAGIGAVSRPVTVTERKRADANQFRSGVYAQDNWSLDSWEFVPGARFDYFTVKDEVSDSDDTVAGLSGSFGTVYKISTENSLYSSLSTGFRAPDLGERYQDGIVNLGVPTRIIGNPDLDPERSYSAEIGAKHQDGNTALELAGFVTRVQDYIGTTPVGVVQGFLTDQYANLGDLNLYGVELGSSTEFFDALEVYANVSRTWTNASEKIDVTGWVFNYGALYTIEANTSVLDRVRTGFNLRTVGPSTENTVSAGRDQFPKQADFTVVDFQLNFLLAEQSFGKASIVSGVKNLFDKNYKEPFFSLTQPGRNAYVALQLNF
jgi:hemoglobin/transferrin/lactoferrin receptor protein